MYAEVFNVNQAQGKETLRNCLEQVAPELNLDALISYRTGNRKHAQDYQDPEIITDLTDNDKAAIAKGATYIVKCFYHFDVYVAWNVESGKARGKYVVYRDDVKNMENGLSGDYDKRNISGAGGEKDYKAYLFKGESGIVQFIRKQLIK